MPANMSRLRQVGGMSTRESLNRPRIGTRRWQGEHVQDDRLNRAQTRGYDGPATTVYTRGKVFNGKRFENANWPRQEKVFGTGTDIKYLLSACRKADPSWQPSKFAPKDVREHAVLRSRGLLD